MKLTLSNVKFCGQNSPMTSRGIYFLIQLFNKISGEGIDLLCSSIGTSIYRQITTWRLKLMIVLHCIRYFYKWCELALIRWCAGICKIKSDLRTSPTKFISNSINKYNNSIRKSLAFVNLARMKIRGVRILFQSVKVV